MTNRRFMMSLAMAAPLMACSIPFDDEEMGDDVGEAEQEITFGSRLDLFQLDGKYQAIGTIPGCSATLVNHELVLTAAHCVCPGSSPVGCSTRSTFVMKNVIRLDDPATGVDESLLGPTNVAIDGDVVVYPDFGSLGWMREDYALVELDEPVYDVAIGVVPHPVGGPSRTPSTSDLVSIAGYGGTGSDCSGSGALGRIALTSPSEVVTDAIRFTGSVLACPGDSGGPVLDADLFVLGVASWNSYSGGSPTMTTYRPAYEVVDWIQDHIEDLETSSDRARFDVSRGGSWDLGAYNQTYTEYVPAVGIVGQAISPNDGFVYTWYQNGTYSVGRTWDLGSAVEQDTFTVYPAYRPDEIVGMAFSSNNLVYTWYRWGTVSVGTPGDLDGHTAPYSFTTSPGHSPEDIVGIDIASTDYVYTWYNDGNRSIGRTWDLDANGVGTYAFPSGKTADEVAEIAIAQNNDHIYTWYLPE